jgi:hypothetical protein
MSADRRIGAFLTSPMKNSAPRSYWLQARRADRIDDVLWAPVM